MMHYRKEIDGLRALAVVSVILYHTGLGWVPGGYAGVDVFFVISGYLITAIIAAALAEGTFSLARFYERRARRILPALFLVTLVCIPFAWLWMTRLQLQEFFESVAAVAMFVSNFLFWQQSDYFGVAAATKPLLHTWSLAVEEQFYVLFPLLMLLLWRGRRATRTAAIVALALASLAFCQVAAQLLPAANFYLAPSRVWELMLGALLALPANQQWLRQRIGLGMQQALSLLGLAAMAASFFVFDHATPFPSLYALLPTLGTALILAFGRDGTLAARLLGFKPLVGIGLISYSAYLWHQPLFAFARLRSIDQPSALAYALLSIGALGLAYLSWRWVERPFRDRRRIDVRWVWRGAVLVGVVLVGAGLAGRFTKASDLAFRFGFDAHQLAAAQPANGNDAARGCRWETPLPEFPRIRACRFGDAGGDKTVLLYGDSHANALFSALDRRLKQQHVAGLLIENRYCGAIVGIYPREKANLAYHRACLRGHAALLDYARRLAPQGVVVSIRWTFQLYPVRGAIDSLDFDNGEGGAGDENYREYYAFDEGGFVQDGAVKAALLKGFVQSLLDTKLPVFLVYPVPEAGWRVADHNFKHLVAGRGVPPHISTDFARFKVRQRFVVEQLDAVADQPNLMRIKPSEIFCDTYLPGRCVAQFDGQPFYNDDDHLNDAGAALLVDRIAARLP